MSEKNKAILEQAIKSLPDYPAPAQLWESIEQDLIQLKQEDLLQESIPRLKSHQAPEFVWNQIEEVLEKPQTRTLIAPKIKRIAWSAAAAIALIMSLSVWNWVNNTKDQFEYSHYTEKQDKYLLQNDWDADEAEFALVVQQFTEYLKVFNDPAGTALIEEWEELNEAKTELEEAMNLFGKDKDFMNQIGSLEWNRTEVIKKMATKI